MKILSLAFRSLFHFRFYSLINILGLALSLTCTVIIFRYVYGEFTVNHFNSHLDRTYVAISDSYYNSTGKQSFALTKVEYFDTFDPENPTFNGHRNIDLLDVPGVQASTRFEIPGNEEVEYNGKNFTSAIIKVENNFFDIADYHIIAGAQSSILPMFTTIITKEFARRVFGDEDPLGKQIKRHDGDLLTVTGIIDDIATKSSFDFDLVTFGRGFTPVKTLNLIMLYPGQDPKEIEKRINETKDGLKEFADVHFSQRMLANAPDIKLMPLDELYFTDKMENYPQLNFGNILNVTLLLTVGVLIMFIGCINFINIYTAVTMRRGREFGMKKVFGADAWQIFMQMWVENLIMVTLAILLGMALTEMFSPVVRNILGLEQIPFSFFDYTVVGCVLLALPLLTTLYPFYKYYYSTPVTSLRDVGKTGGRNLSRYVFLAIQYATAIFMIVLSIFFVRHLNRMINTDLGFRAHDIIKVQPIRKVFSMEGAEILSTRVTEDGKRITYYANNDSKTYEWDNMFIQRISSSSLFENVILGPSPVNPVGRVKEFRIPGGEPIDVRTIDVRLDWLRLFEIITFDKDFSTQIQTAASNTPDLIVTDSFLRMFYIEDWRESRIEDDKERSLKIIGVVNDFNGFYLGKSVEPIVFTIYPPIQFHMFYNLTTTPLLASIVPGKRQEAIAFLSDLYDELAQGQFNYSFIEDEVRAMYDEDKKVAMIYSVFTIIAILISMLGLFSMSLFDIEQRYNEIAIRKVNGATTGQIISMLLRKYVILLSIAFLIAAPAAWFVLTKYLENFAFKTPISWWIFALALLVTAGVSLLTLIVQTKKAAETNPASVIRNE